MKISPWIEAFRLRTLPLSLSCIAMGGFLAVEAHAFRWDIFLLCILTTIFLQVLSNLANDYGDTVHGADNEYRQGPMRAVQSGAITAKAMRFAILTFVLLSLSSGLMLLFVAFESDWKGMVFFVVLGVLSITAAIAYTVGRKPYGYLGLGDISVFIFFGLIGVLGSCYLFTKHITWIQVLPAASCGFFSVGVLNINNIRDVDSDRKAGKFSVPVRIGRDRAIIYHWFLLLAGIACGLIYTGLTFESYPQLLLLLSLPMFARNAVAVSTRPSHALDPFLKQMALSTLAFVILFGLGIIFR